MSSHTPPELLEAAEKTVAYLTNVFCAICGNAPDEEHWSYCPMPMLQSAIRKAKGEPQ